MKSVQNLPPLDDSAPKVEAHGGLAVLLLAIAAFVIVSTEFLIVGLIPSLSQDLNVSIPVAGQLVTLFAVTVALFGPVLTATLAHLNRKKLFVGILLLFAASNALAALAPNIWVLGFARFIPALALPVFWGTASETAGEIAGPARAGKAVSKVYLGISAAMVFGIPLGTLASSAFGWRASFWGLAALSLLMAVALRLLMPQVKGRERAKIRDQMRILKDPVFLGHIILSVLVFTAMFTGYTYLADTLERTVGIPSANVGWWLMGFGAVGIIGNWIGGQIVGNNPLRATFMATVALMVGLLAFPIAVGSGVWFILVLGLWGVANTALYPICQVRVMKAAPQAQALAGTLNVSMANVGIGLGAVIGGFTIERLGLENIEYVAAAIAFLAAITVPVVYRLGQRRANLRSLNGHQKKTFGFSAGSDIVGVIAHRQWKVDTVIAVLHGEVKESP